MLLFTVWVIVSGIPLHVELRPPDAAPSLAVSYIAFVYLRLCYVASYFPLSSCSLAVRYHFEYFYFHFSALTRPYYIDGWDSKDPRREDHGHLRWFPGYGSR